MNLPYIYDVDISQPLVPTVLQPMLVTGDKLANRIGVRLKNGAQDYTPDGSCVGYVLRADGATVPILNGAVSGNLMYIDLPEAAYAVQGAVVISIVCVTTTATTTVFLGSGSVNRSQSNVVIDPGTVIDDVSTLIQQIETAVASIPADYSDLLATLAPNFSSSANYTAGQYVWNEGTLYRFTADHAAGAWTGTDAMLAIVGTDLASVAKNLNAFADGYIHETSTEITNTTSHTGYRYAADGSLVANTPSLGTSVAVEVPVSGGQIIRWVCYYANRNSTYNVKYLMSDNSVVTDTNYTSSGNEYVFTVPANCVKLLVTCWVLDDPGNTFYRVTYSADRVKTVIDNLDTTVDLVSEKATSAMLGTAPVFANTVAYSAGDYVWYLGTLYRFTADHAAGSWTGTDVEEVEIGEEIADLKTAIGAENVSYDLTKITGLNFASNATAYSNASGINTEYTPVSAGDEVTVTLKNTASVDLYVRIVYSSSLPANGVSGTLLTQEQVNNTTVTYTYSVQSDGYIGLAYYGANATNATFDVAHYVTRFDALERVVPIAATNAEKAVNALNIQRKQMGWICADGLNFVAEDTKFTASGAYTTLYVPIASGKKYTLSIYNSASLNFTARVIMSTDVPGGNVAGTHVETLISKRVSKSHTFTAEANGYAALAFYTGDSGDVTFLAYDCEEDSKRLMDDEKSLADLKCSDANTFPLTDHIWVKGEISTMSGDYDDNKRVRSDYIRVSTGDRIDVTGNMNCLEIVEYTDALVLIQKTRWLPNAYTVPSGVSYIRVILRAAIINPNISDDSISTQVARCTITRITPKEIYFPRDDSWARSVVSCTTISGLWYNSDLGKYVTNSNNKVTYFHVSANKSYDITLLRGMGNVPWVRIAYSTEIPEDNISGPIVYQIDGFTPGTAHIEYYAKNDGYIGVAFTNNVIVGVVETSGGADLVLQEEICAGINRLDQSAKGLFCVMQYNVGSWYNGTSNPVPAEKYDKFVALQSGILDRYRPDFLMVEEFTDKFTTSTYAMDVLLRKRFSSIVAGKGSAGYHGKCIAANRPLLNAGIYAYTVDDRTYEKAYTYINGHKVCLIATHMSLTQSYIETQFEELLAIAENEEYVIICMDSNVSASPSASTYNTTLKLFADEGYIIANVGEFVTYPSSSLTLDNIIFSPNFVLEDVIVDTQKEDLEEGADHYPLVAYFRIKGNKET